MVISEALLPVRSFGTEQGHLSDSHRRRRTFEEVPRPKGYLYAVRPPEGIFSYSPKGEAVTEFPTGNVLDIYA